MKKQRVLFGISAVIALLLFVHSFTGFGIQIREIPDIEDWVAFDYGMPVVIKCYIINRPPSNYDELRELAQRYIDEHWDEIASPDDGPTMYKLFFYRASRRLPMNWEENDAHMMEDHIYHHTDDMIIAVRWTTEDASREYTIMKKSEARHNYGDVLERVVYLGDVKIEERVKQE